MGRLTELQESFEAWRSDNFGEADENTAYQQAMGVSEECGEFIHGVLKKWQGIRKDQDHDAEIDDALGDMVIFMMSYCNLTGRNLEEIIEKTSEQVLKRTRKDQLSRDA